MPSCNHNPVRFGPRRGDNLWSVWCSKCKKSLMHGKSKGHVTQDEIIFTLKQVERVFGPFHELPQGNYEELRA